MDVPPSLTVGQRIKLHRERTGKTRAVLGGLVGRSTSWVKGVETGRLLPPRLPMLDKISRALKVPLADLVGEHGEELQALTGPTHPALPDVRAAIAEVQWGRDAPPEPLAELRERVAAAWRARHSSPDHRTVLGRLLPQLLRDVRYAARMYEGSERRQAQAVLADLLGLTQMYVAYQPDAALLWRVADRAMVAAEESSDPAALAGAAWFAVEALRDSGDWDSAMSVNLAALREVEPLLADAQDDLRGLWGALQTVASLTAARSGEAGRAWRHLDEAERMARQLPDGYAHPWTWFGRPIVGFYATSIDVELRRGGEALQHAARVDPSAITSAPRRARHLIEVARASHLRGQHEDTVRTLRQAHAAAPETIRYNSPARRITMDLLDDGPVALRRDVRDLALAIGVAAG